MNFFRGNEENPTPEVEKRKLRVPAERLRQNEEEEGDNPSLDLPQLQTFLYRLLAEGHAFISV
jgi:hypothetical protein